MTFKLNLVSYSLPFVGFTLMVDLHFTTGHLQETPGSPYMAYIGLNTKNWLKISASSYLKVTLYMAIS